MSEYRLSLGVVGKFATEAKHSQRDASVQLPNQDSTDMDNVCVEPAHRHAYSLRAADKSLQVADVTREI
jgi:hypothetical protein